MEKNDCPYRREIDFPSIFDGEAYTMSYCSRDYKMPQCNYGTKEKCFKWRKRLTVFCPACGYETLTGEVEDGKSEVKGYCSHCCRNFWFKLDNGRTWYSMEDEVDGE